MKKILIITLFASFAIVNMTYATTGCLIGSTLYTHSNGTGSGKTYYDTSPSMNASGFCLRNGTSTTPCQTRTWFGWGSFGFWINGDNGIKGDFGPSNPPTYCPIDDYAGLLLIGAGGIGLYFLSRREFSI